MKLIAIFFCLLPAIAFAQTKADYEHAMNKFMMFYNKQQGDSINAMFSHEWDNVKRKMGPLWTNEKCKSQMNEYGKMVSCKFLGIDSNQYDRIYIFLTVFSKAGKKGTSIILDKDKLFSDFRLATSSPKIEELLKKVK